MGFCGDSDKPSVCNRGHIKTSERNNKQVGHTLEEGKMSLYLRAMS
jgi:hypothetical protein